MVIHVFLGLIRSTKPLCVGVWAYRLNQASTVKSIFTLYGSQACCSSYLRFKAMYLNSLY